MSDADTSAKFADFSAVPEAASVKAVLLNDDTLAPAWSAKELTLPEPESEGEGDGGSESEGEGA